MDFHIVSRVLKTSYIFLFLSTSIKIGLGKENYKILI
jgi:hypothetical protein